MRRISTFSTVLAGAIAGAIVALVIGLGHSSKTVTVTEQGSSSPASGSTSAPVSTTSTGSALNINQIYKKDSAGVVDIDVTAVSNSSGSGGSGGGGGLFGLGGGGTQESQDEGSGVVYDNKGDIITDEHVVTNATKVVVNFQNGVSANAKVLGSDPSTDVAVIRVEGVKSSELHPIPFVNSSNAQVGDAVVAIGSPFSLPETVTAGIVSAVGRSITAPNGYTILGSIQTDAAINPGNSGGPLLAANGDVLGLNDQIQTSSGDSAGIGFATPGNTDVEIANRIIAGEKVTHAYVGVCVQDATSGSGAMIPTSYSQQCASGNIVAGSPASKAGLKAGDVITAINGRKVTGDDSFVEIISNYKPGQTVTFTVKSGSKTSSVKVKLGNRPASAPTSG
jgi:putative serine protease PepD